MDGVAVNSRDSKSLRSVAALRFSPHIHDRDVVVILDDHDALECDGAVDDSLLVGRLLAFATLLRERERIVQPLWLTSDRLIERLTLSITEMGTNVLSIASSTSSTWQAFGLIQRCCRFGLALKSSR